MFLNYLVLAVSITGLLNSKEVAYVDLTATPNTRDSGSTVRSVRAGGLLHHGAPNHASPETPTLSLRITRLITNDEGGAPHALEVTATNVGKTPVTVPIGADSSTLLNPSEKGRRYLLFSVNLTGPIQVGTAESASSAGHPDSRLLLQPGDQITFLLPINTGLVAGAGKEVGIAVQLYERIDDKGKEFEQAIGDPIKSSTFPLQ